MALNICFIPVNPPQKIEIADENEIQLPGYFDLFHFIHVCSGLFRKRNGSWIFFIPCSLIPFKPLFLFQAGLITAHGSWPHLIGNFMIILLVGPLLEEKYGSTALLEMIFITAIATALLNAILFSNSLIGGSGIAFMLILLSSFSNIRSKEIPLTFIIIATLYIGSEVLSTLKVDRISQFSHLAGGFIGAGYGFFRSGKRNL